MADRDPVPLPAEVRAKLAELELELSEGEYLKCTAKLGGSGPGWWVCGSPLGGRTGSEFELCGGKVSRVEVPSGPRSPNERPGSSGCDLDAGGGVWCLGGVSVRRKRAELWTDGGHLTEYKKKKKLCKTQHKSCVKSATTEISTGFH